MVELELRCPGRNRANAEPVGIGGAWLRGRT